MHSDVRGDCRGHAMCGGHLSPFRGMGFALCERFEVVHVVAGVIAVGFRAEIAAGYPCLFMSRFPVKRAAAYSDLIHACLFSRLGGWPLAMSHEP